MNELELDSLTPDELIARFVIVRRGIGVSLSPDDFRQIRNWLSYTPDPDRLLCILDDIMPPQGSQKRPLPLKLFHKRVMKRLNHSNIPPSAIHA
ncbi:MAG: hypothetical protein H6618_00580 [Deltaproteobacteria bacterium]|nr:hypothetical protein [Deltaproteobacteria bacterium]